MKIAIRVDASTRMGIGHLKRCLSLARALARFGAQVSFVVRDLGLDSGAWVSGAGFAVWRLPHPAAAAEPIGNDSPAHAAWAAVPQSLDADQTGVMLEGQALDWIVVDSYAFDARWHERVRQLTGARLCVIDDLADRPMQAAMLVDHNLAVDHRKKYGSHAAGVARILGGPRFALLDPSYEDAPPYRFSREVRSIGVFMGGTDPWGASEAAVAACRDVARFAGPIEIATTAANPHLSSLRALCVSRPGVRLLLDMPELTAFFARHDLQIGAGGGAVWERCCIGAPTIAAVMADNQKASLAELAAVGAVCKVDALDPSSLGLHIARLIEDFSARADLARCSRQLVDGKGATRVALAIMAEALELRPATVADAARAYRWRNAAATRRHFRDPSEIEWESHRVWWSRCLDDPQRRLLVATCGELEVGVLRLDISRASAEVSLYLDPQLHGLGLGAALLRAGQEWARRQEPTLECLTAEVLLGNDASAATFDAAGFVRTQPQRRLWEIPR